MLLYSNRDLTVIFVVKSLQLQNNPIFYYSICSKIIKWTMLLYSNRDLTVIFVVKSLQLQNNPIFTTVFAVKS